MRTRQDDDEGPLDRNGVLKDGRSTRVSLILRDSSPDWRDAADKHFNRCVKVTDGSGGTLGLHRPGHRLGRTVNNDEREAAYAEHEASLVDAWRQPQQQDAGPPGSYPYTAAAEGSPCTIDGWPGTLQREGNYLVCKRTNNNDHKLTMDAIYQQHDRWLENQWRSR